MQCFFTTSWIEDWLAGLVHPACRADLAERSRHERFLIARTASTLGALVALPPFLLDYSVPTVLEALALVALASPVGALALLSRFGRLDIAQVVVSLALAPFAAAAVASYGGVGSAAVLTLAILPLDALFSGRKQAILVAVATALVGIPLALVLEPGAAGRSDDLTAVFVVGLALGFGHALAHAVCDRRLSALLRLARSAGEARESATLLAIDDLVTWHDRNGSVVRANSAATKLVGVPSSLLQGRGLFDRIHVADRPSYLKTLSDAATSAEPVVAILRLQVGTGDEGACSHGSVLARLPARSRPTIWVELRAHRLHPAEGETCAVVAVTRDISHHRQLAEDLESRCRRAEQAAESRAELLAAVGEELRTSLNAIVGYSELMSPREGPLRLGASRDYPRLILERGQHVLGVVSSLIDLATIDAGRYDLAPEPLDVADLVSDGCRAIRLAADRAGVALATDVGPDLPELHADPRACRKLLLHLLSTAIEFTPQGGLVAVQARREGDRIALTVRETARCSRRELPRLADPFSRARPGKEASLGLTVVRSLVALQGGRMDVASTLDGGRSASVSLPLEARGRLRAEAAGRKRKHPRFSDGALALETG